MNQIAIVRTLLSVSLVCGYFYLASIVMTQELPEGNKEAANIVLGVLTGVVGMVFNFYFASSQGSKEKTDILKSIVKPGEPGE